MCAVRMRVQTDDKSFTIIHTTHPSIKDLRIEKLPVFNKQIHQDIFKTVASG